MDIINSNELSHINGGNFVYVAIGTGVTTYIGAASIVSATQTLNQFGHAIGEQVFNSTHPDQLGQMVYPVVVIIDHSEPNK
jgi:hypothetical protein